MANFFKKVAYALTTAACVAGMRGCNASTPPVVPGAPADAMSFVIDKSTDLCFAQYTDKKSDNGYAHVECTDKVVKLATPLTEKLDYVREPSTGICFAQSHVSNNGRGVNVYAGVPCTPKVMRQIQTTFTP